MAMSLNPYLNFSGSAREAMEFYQDVLGGKLMIRTFKEFGMKDPEFANKVMHAKLETSSGLVLMGSDVPVGMPGAPPELAELKVGNNVSVALTGDQGSRNELMKCWDQLSSSGKVIMPMGKQSWGDDYGACTDRFGIHWSVNIAQVGS